MIRKDAKTKLEINENLKKRWSPRAFSDEPIQQESLRRIFEAARWAPSSMNEQPWRFVIGLKNDGETYDKLLDALAPFNQQWAKTAPLIGVVIGQKKFEGKDKDNKHGSYDPGQAMAHLSVQVMEEGLFIHQMGGFSRTKMTDYFKIPDNYFPIAAFAIGKQNGLEVLPEDLQEEEQEERERKPVKEFVFTGEYGNSFSFEE